ncbi:DUF512 domain-containing protein [Anaerotignum faecicola]|nr:DUF512 domain-containing protein [Anaerotignum faecicola]
MKKKENVIIKVEKGSIAEELGIEPGDILVAVNGQEILDVFDYRYLINDEYIEMTVKTRQGEECIAEIEKDYDEDIGIIFESGLMDDARSCRNKCIFCFIDQLPKGMRETLYFKDDDTRLSFLQGNYCTLTNMSESDIDRIVYYHLSPINISVHTTDMELRKKMLNNKNAGLVLERMKKLAAAGIEMNLQIVLCKGINDGEKLDSSIKDLAGFYPRAKSLSVVPIGLTRYRDGLYPMEPFEKDDCAEVINSVKKWQSSLKKEIGSNFVYASDEFYLTAGIDFPEYGEYEDFPQIENGVGMIASMKKEFMDYFGTLKSNPEINRTVSVATGTAAFEFIKSLSKMMTDKFENLRINVFAVQNDFFGGRISVSGLLCGCDIIGQLKGKELGEFLCLPQNVLRSGEEVLLDDITLRDIERELGVKVRITGESGEDFIKTILD